MSSLINHVNKQLSEEVKKAHFRAGIKSFFRMMSYTGLFAAAVVSVFRGTSIVGDVVSELAGFIFLAAMVAYFVPVLVILVRENVE